MHTRSSSNLPVESSPNPTTFNPKHRNRRRSKQPFILEESPVDTMADQRTTVELLRAPTEGYAEAIVVPLILADQFKLKHNLLRACPHHGFTELHQLDTFYNALNPADQDSLNSAVGGNLLERCTKDVLTIIKNKFRNSRNKSIVSHVKSSDANFSFFEIAKLTHTVNQQTSVVTTAMTAILKQFQATSPPASIKAVEEICVTCGGAHPYYQCLVTGGNTFSELRDNIQGYVAAAAVNFNQGNSSYHPLAKYQKMLKALLSNKEKLLELANTPLNENCSEIILKKFPKKLRDPGKFLIPCGFSELKCKALSDLGASINLMPLSVWKKLGLLELISTRMTLELANWAICTPARIVRDVFISVGKFTFPADFVIVDYESDLRVPLILGRPFLRTTCALIDVHREEMILHDSDERLTLNIRHDTSSYSNQPQKESINMINIYDDSSEYFLENLFATNHQSGNPTFSSHPNLTSPKVKDHVFDPEGGNVLTRKYLDLDSTKDLYPPHNVNPLSDSTTTSSLNHLLEEFADELTLITFSLRNDDLPFDIESDLKEIEYLLNDDPIKEMDSILEDSVDEGNLANLNDNLADTMPKMFTEEHALDYSSPPLYDDDDLFEVKSSDFLPSFEYGSFLFEYFFEVDALPSTNNEDKVFNLGILIQENLFEVITRVVPDKNVKKLAISDASLILEEFDPPPYEISFFKKVLDAETPLSFSSENEKKVFKLRILTSIVVHSSLILELSHRGYKFSKSLKFLKARSRFFFSLIEKTSASWVFLVPIYVPQERTNAGIGSS
nr:hypothetical protein [Tanacetum cinerariifolium]